MYLGTLDSVSRENFILTDFVLLFFFLVQKRSVSLSWFGGNVWFVDNRVRMIIKVWSCEKKKNVANLNAFYKRITSSRLQQNFGGGGCKRDNFLFKC